MISIVYSDEFLLHDTGAGHPERAERIVACVDALKASRHADRLDWMAPRRATVDELGWIHTPEHIQRVGSLAEKGGGHLDPDTPMCPESYQIALLSAGAWLTGVDEVLDRGRSAFIISRPPGHHAESDRAMGFCLFSNCALAAKYAVEKKGIARLAIFDWDVHHGNGTQHIVESDRRIAYSSIHQYPFYPGTGSRSETGDHDNVLNIPLPAGCGSLEYRTVFDEQVEPFLKNFGPDLLIISAGFDAALRDPLANMNLVPEDYRELTSRCLEISPKLLLGLEGGYDLDSLGQSVVSVADALVGNG